MTPAELNEPISLAHLERMTDCFGLVQHANYSLPDFRTGYTTDDNARALVVALKHYQLYHQPRSLELVERYLAFLIYAQTEEGRFHNFFGYDRRPVDDVGSEDAFGRALWALAHVLAFPPSPSLRRPAYRMLCEALEWVERLHHPRSKAYCLSGLYRWSQAEDADLPRAQHLARGLADYLVSRYRDHSRPGWDWLLPEFTYANASLPSALFRAYQLLGDEGYLQVAIDTMNFLTRLSRVDEKLSVVGNREWLAPDGSPEPARFDQQPIEASLMVQAQLAAHDATGDPVFLQRAWLALRWFFGHNVSGLSLYDPETGGCFDALMEHGVNENRGAESTVSLLLARLLMAEARLRLSDGLLTEKGISLLPNEAAARGPAELDGEAL